MVLSQQQSLADAAIGTSNSFSNRDTGRRRHHQARCQHQVALTACHQHPVPLWIQSPQQLLAHIAGFVDGAWSRGAGGE